ncbi:MAG: hypothetical protein ABW096_04530 [Candidatus Thiodiazotropha sp.]
MADETREINVEVEVESPYKIDIIKEAVNAKLNGSWDPETGNVKQIRKIEVYIGEVDDYGVFNDPLTEERYYYQLREDLIAQFRDVLSSTIENS